VISGGFTRWTFILTPQLSIAAAQDNYFAQRMTKQHGQNVEYLKINCAVGFPGLHQSGLGRPTLLGKLLQPVPSWGHKECLGWQYIDRIA
jgi:hypothetical protein